MHERVIKKEENILLIAEMKKQLYVKFKA